MGPPPAASRSLLFFYLHCLLTLSAANMFTFGMTLLSRAVAGSQSFTNAVFFAEFALPTLLLSPYAGSLLDRFSRKRVLAAFQLLYAVNLALLIVLLSSGVIESSAWLLLPSAFLAGTAQTFVIPARLALLGNLASESELGKAAIRLNILVIFTFGIAFPLTGQLRVFADWPLVFSGMLLLFIAGMAFLAPVRIVHAAPTSPLKAWAGIREAVAFASRKGIVLELLAVVVIAYFIVGPLQVLVPRYCETELNLNPAEAGWVLLFLALGLLIGGILAQLVARFDRGLWILGSMLATGAFSVVLSATPTRFAASLVLGCLGVSGGLLASLVVASLQTAVPDGYRGRIMALYGLLFRTTPAASALALGPVTDSIGLVRALYAGGLAVAAAAVFGVFLLPALRRVRSEAGLRALVRT